MKKHVSIFIVCILLACLCACTSEPSLVSTTPKGSDTPTETPTVADEKVFHLGDSVELDDVVVTFIDVTESKGSKYNKPDDGKVFVLCEFEIVNKGQEDLSVSSMLSFEAYCDDYSCDYSISALAEKGDKNQLDGSVAAGKKMRGVIGYELPTDWAQLEIQYTLDVWSDDKIVFVATNA